MNEVTDATLVQHTLLNGDIRALTDQEGYFGLTLCNYNYNSSFLPCVPCNWRCKSNYKTLEYSTNCLGQIKWIHIKTDTSSSYEIDYLQLQKMTPICNFIPPSGIRLS